LRNVQTTADTKSQFHRNGLNIAATLPGESRRQSRRLKKPFQIQVQCNFRLHTSRRIAVCTSLRSLTGWLIGVQLVFVLVELVDDVMTRGEVKVKVGAVWFLPSTRGLAVLSLLPLATFTNLHLDTTASPGWRRTVPRTLQRVEPILQRRCQILQQVSKDLEHLPNRPPRLQAKSRRSDQRLQRLYQCQRCLRRRQQCRQHLRCPQHQTLSSPDQRLAT
jgi:hypothetical protein